MPCPCFSGVRHFLWTFVEFSVILGINKNCLKAQSNLSGTNKFYTGLDFFISSYVGGAMGMQALLVNFFHQLVECHYVKMMVLAKVCATLFKIIRISQVAIKTGEENIRIFIHTGILERF